MIEYAEAALAFVHGRSREDMETDVALSFALARALEIVGEAASKISRETRASLREVPWTQIISMRNRLIHVYHDLNHNIIWRTATAELPALLPLLRAALPDNDPR